jgi:hypothetical protein
MLIFAIEPAFTGIAMATSWETSSMRTPGGGLVRVGMSRQEVIKELGQPLHARSGARNTASGEKSGRKNNTWAYRGTDGVYVITFSGETVVRIDVTPDRD